LKQIFFLFFFFSQSFVNAQDQPFYPYTTNSGLSQNSVTSIAQDSFGFLWIATQDGLNRFDGTNFKKYSSYFEDVTNENFSRLGKVFVDSLNKVWLITSDGVISQYDWDEEKIKEITHLEDASNIIHHSRDQYLVSSYTKGLYLFLQDKSELQPLISNIGVYNILKDAELLLLGTSKGVVKYDINKAESISLFSSLNNNHISDLQWTEDGSLIISTFADGVFVSHDMVQVERLNGIPQHLRVQDIHIARDNSIWIATYSDGLYKIKDEKVEHYFHQPPLQNKINYNDILCIYEDYQSNLLIGTDGGGFSILNKLRKPIKSVTNADLPVGITVDVPRAISTDRQGNIWVGTSGKGLTQLHRDGASHRHYSTSQSLPYYISNNRIMSLCHDQADNLWIGTQEGGLLLKRENETIISSIISEASIKTIWHIHETKNRTLLLGTRSNGLVLFNPINGELKKFESTLGKSIRVIIDGQDDNEYYIGTDEGNIIRFDEDQEKFTTVHLGVENEGIKALYLDNNHLWMGTQGSGIIIYNIETQKTRTLDDRRGLPNNVAYALLSENEETIWTSTNTGICEISKSKAYADSTLPVLQYLTYNNGLVSNEFNTGAYYKDEQGVFYFGGIDGINYFNPADILKNRKPSDLLLLELITNSDGVKSTRSLHDKAKTEIPYTLRHFQIRYSDLSYGQGTSTKYKFRLVGYDNEWIDNEDFKLANFSNVPPGDYTFELKASNQDGIWNIIPKKLDIEIKPAFWQTLWFRLLCAAILLFTIYKIVQGRISYFKRDAELKQRIALSEAKALRSQMNPHFLFNSLNAIDNYILNNDSEKASDYLSKFSKLIRQTLDYSSQATITLQQEIEVLGLYIKMEQMRFPAKFDYSLTVDPDINLSEVRLPPLIIQPYVENAIWHGLMHLEGDGELNVHFSRYGVFIRCEIDDNGIGRKSAGEIKSKSAIRRKSHGMSITAERLKLLEELKGSGGDVTVEDKYSDMDQSLGTTVIIKLPQV